MEKCGGVIDVFKKYMYKYVYVLEFGVYSGKTTEYFLKI